MSDQLFKHKGLTIDVGAMLWSAVNRWDVYMLVSEISHHHGTDLDHPDATGHIVIVGPLGVVDGFSKLRKLSQDPRSVSRVFIFPLRNAQGFITHEYIEKTEGAKIFPPNSMPGTLMLNPDAWPYTAHLKTA